MEVMRHIIYITAIWVNTFSTTILYTIRFDRFICLCLYIFTFNLSTLSENNVNNLYPIHILYEHWMYTTQKKLRVKGNYLIIFVSMSSLVWTSFWGYMTFYHQGNKLVSNQTFLCVFSVREPSKNCFVISRHHFSSLAYIYMHTYFDP